MGLPVVRPPILWWSTISTIFSIVELVHCLSHLIVVYQDDLLVGRIGELLRVCNFEVIQHELCLVVDVSCGSGNCLFHSHSVLQIGICYCRCYRIGIRALVPNYVDLVGQVLHLSIVNVELRLKAYWAIEKLQEIVVPGWENFINSCCIQIMSL